MRPTPRPLAIGIIACSAEGASLCYRTLCSEGPAPFGHPEVALHSHPMADYVRCLEAQDLQGVADLMLSSARKLAAAGAELLICPDNTIHQAFDRFEATSPLPMLHIAEVVAEAAASRGFRRLGLLGTKWLVASDVYPRKLESLGIACVRPADADRGVVSDLIMDELVHGVFAPESAQRVCEVISWLEAQGCDAVVLGCTELPLLLGDHNSPLPTLDSTRLLARAALARSLGSV